jgi:cbb3-type cytochrome oxidase cytochrome c subunit
VRWFVTLVTLTAMTLGTTGSWGQALETHGLDLARRLGCFACHSLQGQGGDLAAPLDGIGVRLSPQKLQTAITAPRRLCPQAKMPSYAYLPPAEQEALVKYLESLK